MRSGLLVVLGLASSLAAWPVASAEACKSGYMDALRSYPKKILPRFRPIPKALPKLKAPQELHKGLLSAAKKKPTVLQMSRWFLLVGHEDRGVRRLALGLLHRHDGPKRLPGHLEALLGHQSPSLRRAATRLAMATAARKARFGGLVLRRFRRGFRDIHRQPWARRRQLYLAYRHFLPGQLGAKDRQLQQKGLKDPHLWVQHGALVGLLLSTKDKKSLVPVLQKRMGHGHLPSRLAALCAVSVLGKAARPLVPQLLALTTHKDPEFQMAALLALHTSESRKKSVALAFIRALQSKYREQARVAFLGAAEMPLHSSWALAPLAGRLFSSKGKLRMLILRLLLQMKDSTPTMIRLLQIIQKRGNQEVLDIIVQQLRGNRWDARHILPLLRDLLVSKKAQDQSAGMSLLSSLPKRPHASAVMAALFPLVYKHRAHPTVYVRAQALQFLLHVANAPKKVIPLLKKGLLSRYSTIREQAAKLAYHHKAHKGKFGEALWKVAQGDLFPKIRRLAKASYVRLFGNRRKATSRPARKPKPLFGSWFCHSYGFLMGSEVQTLVHVELAKGRWKLTQSNLLGAMFPGLRRRLEKLIQKHPKARQMHSLMMKVTRHKDPSAVPQAQRKKAQALFLWARNHPRYLLAIQILVKYEQYRRAPKHRRSGLYRREQLAIVARKGPLIVGRLAGKGFRAMAYGWSTDPRQLRVQISEKLYKTKAKALAFRPRLSSQKATRFLPFARYKKLLALPIRDRFSAGERKQFLAHRERISELDLYVLQRQSADPSMGLARHILLNGELHLMALEAMGINPFLSVLFMIKAQDDEKAPKPGLEVIEVRSSIGARPELPRPLLGFFDNAPPTPRIGPTPRR